MKKRIFLLTAVAVIALFTLCACGNQNTNTAPNTPNQSTGQTEQNNDDNKKPNSESENTTTATDGTYSKSRSQTIKEAIDSEMSDAREIWVMVNGDMAYIALDIASEDSTGEAADVKEQAAQIALNADNKLTDVYVSADADTLTRVKDTFKDLTDGKPISGLSTEITNLFTRITPTASSK